MERPLQVCANPECIRVLLIDNSSLTVQGLKAVLSKTSSIVVVGAASTPGEAVDALDVYRPDVAVMDVCVGRASGIDLCRTIRESYPKTGVLFFTSNDNKNLLRSAILAGAQGYLLKRASSEALAKSIEIVSAGKAILDPQLTGEVLAWVRDGGRMMSGKRVQQCSNADLKILSLVASGKTNNEIAQELNLRGSVLATRLRRLYKRLNISNRSQAARYFVQWEHGIDG